MSPRNREIPALDLLQDTLETAVARQHQWIRDTYSRLRGQQAPTGNKGDEEIVENQALTHEEIKVALALRYKEVRAECEEQAAQAWEELTERSDLEAFKYTCDCAAYTWQFVRGIQAAAEALGISSGELVIAAQAAGAEGRQA